MKVTALIPDDLIHAVSKETQGKNLTESLIIALKEWLKLRNISQLNRKIMARPLEFTDAFSAEKVRSVNRRR